MEVVISCRAESASCCLVFSSALCSAARLFSSSTSALASFSLDTPACRQYSTTNNVHFSKMIYFPFVFGENKQIPTPCEYVFSTCICVSGYVSHLQMLLPGGELALLPAIYFSVNVEKGHVLAGCCTMLPAWLMDHQKQAAQFSLSGACWEAEDDKVREDKIVNNS